MLSFVKMLYVVLIGLLFLGCETKNKEEHRPAIDINKTKLKAAEALRFCQKKKYNTQFCVLIDMSLHSGINRFMIWDFEKDTVSHTCLVSHGCCESTWASDESKENPGFSAVEGSHCTALGKYKIGERGVSSWGIHVKYLMHGLEPGNKNALARQIVFHSWDAISETETYPAGTPEGWGCPAVSNNNMKKLDEKLKQQKKPVLMWIYR